MLTKREKEIILSAMSLARGVLKRHGEEGYSVLDYQNELSQSLEYFWAKFGSHRRNINRRK